MRFLMTTDTVGGVWTFTSTLTEQLLARGHAVCLVSFGREPSAAQKAWAEQQNSAAFTYQPSTTALEWMQNNENALPLGDEALLRAAESSHPDLLLSNQFCFGASSLPLPRVVVAHSDVLSWARACRPQPLPSSPWLERYTHLVTAGLRAANAVVAPTFMMSKALVDHFAVPHGVEVIPNGVGLPAVPAGTARHLQAITAGRLWDEAKGLDILEEIATLPMPLLIAGEQHFDGTTNSHPLPGNATLLGALTPADLHQRFQQSALYLCTSRYEPFGLAPLEAALCGCAVVARNIPSLREVWGDSALFFDDARSLQPLLQQLAADPQRLAQMQSRAHTRALEYTPERMTDNYLDLFASVLRKAKTAQTPPKEAPHA